jgi:hypothetical protein
MTDPTIARLFRRDAPCPADLALVFGYHPPKGPNAVLAPLPGSISTA